MHNLNEVNGQTAFAATLLNGKKAWHGLGQYVEKAMTAEEALQLAKMDWQVEKKPIYIEHPPGVWEFEPIEKWNAATRSDTQEVLSIVTDSYQIVQNSECFTFFDSIVERGEAIYETAGVLGKGERIFLTAKLPNNILVGGEQIENYILLTNSHDGSSSLQAGFTSVRVVCNNTLSAALHSGLKNSIKLRHTSNVKQMLSEAAEIMGISKRYAAELSESFNMFADVRITDMELRKYIERVMQPQKDQLTKQEMQEISRYTEKVVDEVYEFALENPTQKTDEANGTLWGAYNAISGYYGHVKEHKTASHRMKNLMWGTANERVKDAYLLAVESVFNRSILN